MVLPVSVSQTNFLEHKAFLYTLVFFALLFLCFLVSNNLVFVPMLLFSSLKTLYFFVLNFCWTGTDGLGDMKLIYGTIVARKKDKAEKEDKVSKQNISSFVIFPFNLFYFKPNSFYIYGWLSIISLAFLGMPLNQWWFSVYLGKQYQVFFFFFLVLSNAVFIKSKI